MEPAARIRILARRTHVFRLSLAWLAVLPWQVRGQEVPDRQEAPDRFVLEAGLARDRGGCGGHYVGISARIAGPVSLYGMVENYRCAERTYVTDLGGGITETIIYRRRVGSDNRIGASILLGRAGWLVRPALRAGIQYDSWDHVAPTAGASLTFGRRYQMGGYISF